MKRTLVVALSFALLAISAPILVQADPIISAPFPTVGVGDTFTIPISISEAVDLTSWQFDLAFYPGIVMANSVTEGPFLSSSGTQMTLFIPGVIDNIGGLISLVADFNLEFGTFPSGDGVLANIEFTALAPGVSPLIFSNVFLNLSDQGFGITSGQITVTSASVPEPGLLTLLAISGLGLLGMRRLARYGR